MEIPTEFLPLFMVVMLVFTAMVVVVKLDVETLVLALALGGVVWWYVL